MNVPLVRLASYAICIVAFALATHRKDSIPVSLVGAEYRDAQIDHESAARSAILTLKRPEFLRAQMSGRQVLAAAKIAAKIEGDEIPGFGEPHIGLSQRGDRLLWSVSFYQLGGPPGAFFSIVIDDETGSTEIVPGF